MYINPTRTLKNYLLRFIRYFYDPNATYVEKLLEKWFKFSVDLLIKIFINGFVFWLFLVSLTSVFTINKINLGPGWWHILTIVKLGIIQYFIENTYKYYRGGYKK